MEKGMVIYLEGVSSSGKTTLAKALQEQLEEPYFLLSGDMFWDMAPEKFRENMQVIFPKIDAITPNTMKLFSDLGVNILIDMVPVRGSFKNALINSTVLYVKVYCPLEELDRREINRSDRNNGLAQSQIESLYPDSYYDIVVDTSISTPLECALSIIELLNNKEDITAYKNLPM